jgi:hypothetical protein
LLEGLGGDRLGDTDVKLSDGDIEAGSGELLKLGLEVGETASDKVGLCADTVNWGTTVLDTTDEGNLSGIKSVICLVLD